MPGSLVIINTGLAFFMVYSLTLTDAKTFLIETKVNKCPKRSMEVSGVQRISIKV